jgi:hypothetical protein
MFALHMVRRKPCLEKLRNFLVSFFHVKLCATQYCVAQRLLKKSVREFDRVNGNYLIEGIIIAISKCHSSHLRLHPQSNW